MYYWFPGLYPVFIMVRLIFAEELSTLYISQVKWDFFSPLCHSSPAVHWNQGVKNKKRTVTSLWWSSLYGTKPAEERRDSPV